MSQIIKNYLIYSRRKSSCDKTTEREKEELMIIKKYNRIMNSTHKIIENDLNYNKIQKEREREKRNEAQIIKIT